MKNLIIAMIMLLSTSCAVPNYYQVYKANTENGSVYNRKIVFEDSNCTINYNLWSEGGNIGFSLYNKTENDLVIDLTKTFFVINGIAYEYYQNRIFSNSSTTGASANSYSYPYYRNYIIANVTNTSSSSFSTSYIEKPQISIPAKTSVIVTEYDITDSRYVTCQLDKFPSNKSIKSMNYTINDSPFIFSNLITYLTKSDTIRIENKFYVSEVTNYPAPEMVTEIDTSICGNKLDFPIKALKDLTPDHFYIKYSK